jgi:hypothetical protein
VKIVADRVDENAIGDLTESRGWLLIAQKLAGMRNEALTALIGAESWEATIRAQASLKAIDTVLKLPSILKLEIRQREASSRLSGR